MRKFVKILLLIPLMFVVLLLTRCGKENRVLNITYINETVDAVHMYTGVEKCETDNNVAAHSTLIGKFTVDNDATCLDFAVGKNDSTILTQNLCFGEENSVKVYYNGTSLRIE